VPREQGLSLNDLENIALGSNPTIPAAQALVEQERGQWTQVGLYPNPQVGYLRNDVAQAAPGQSETQGGFFSQEFPTPGKLRLNRAIEAQSIQGRQWQLQAQRERVLNDVRIQFFETLGAQRAVELALELEKLAQETLAMAEHLQKKKVTSRLEVVRAELHLQAIRSALQDARLRYQGAWRQLASIAGKPDLPSAALQGDLAEDIPQLDWEQTLRDLLETNPVLKAQEAKVREARLTWDRARLEAVPNLNVQVVAQHDQVFHNDSVTALVAFPVPLFNRNQGNVYTAAASIQHEASELERQKLALHDQLAGTFRQYLTALNHAERLKKDILPRVKENLELTTQARKAGTFNIFRLLEARQMFFETHLAYIDALTELHKTSIEISGLLLTGGLNPTEIGAALQTRPGMGAVGPRNLLLQQLQEQGQKSRLLPGSVQAITP
jgi:cobalt-zinc-cadmium efflux system outer membrane protein